MNRLLPFLCLALSLTRLSSQDTPLFQDLSITVDDLHAKAFADFLRPHLENSQFVMVGEQHFIQEAGIATKAIYELAEDYDYHTLCIENDDLMVQQITELAGAEDPLQAARTFHQRFPVTVAFYENEEDYDLLSHVVKSGGLLWGIDQTLMSQFRFNFSYLIEQSENEALVKRLEVLLDTATQAYETAIADNNFLAVYYFKYDEATHKELMALAQTPEEREIIFQLGKTKEIYDYNFNRQYYLNNEVRGQLMKSNFMRYYRAAAEETPLPKVVFKLGAYHTYRGLTPTRIYDISNLVSELAIMNGQESLHIRVLGVSGQQAVGFPFAPEPIIEFDNTENFPPEIRDWLAGLDDKKYAVLNLAPLRAKAREYSEELRDFMFAHDILILARDAQPVTTF